MSPERVAGTLGYMSPEQTGRMNRSLDYRSDDYSLGIIFYQMRTGMLPFQSEDPLEWVHFHIARVPRPPAEVVPEIPRPLSDLVMKRLAKVAKELAQQLLTENEVQIASWRARLAQALGLNGQLIVDVIPEVGLILEKQPPVVPLPLTEARQRFHAVFRQFLTAFATSEPPSPSFWTTCNGSTRPAST